MRPHSLSLVVVLACAGVPPAFAQVRPGIEVLMSDSIAVVAGKRVALLTNQTGVDRLGRRDIDLLRGTPGVRLVVILSPEHGIRGTEDRPGLPDAVDGASGLPIYSMYGGTPLPQIAALDSVDVLLVDLQDVGARYYSYSTTAVLLLQEAARRGKPFVVLDRPNPIGGVAVQGNVMTSTRRVERVSDFLPVAMRHGMTVGELVRFANDVLGIHARLTVVPALGWHRGMYYDDTGLPWVRPSPNLRDLESATHYPGTCLFEGTNLSVGRGTMYEFQVVGAPWLDTAAVLSRLRVWGPWAQGALTGVEASGVVLTPRDPTDRKYDDVEVRGIRLRATDRRRYDPTRAAILMLSAIRAAHPDSLRFDDARFDQLTGGPELRRAILAPRVGEAVWGAWEGRLERFRRLRAKYLLY
ncbi:MAG TPA: DUF1343 domain-containing protein [Gemmatimonadales bacterium]|nr:DUF1343 domain-containing protein [Gemmatimonadales bacterium]